MTAPQSRPNAALPEVLRKTPRGFAFAQIVAKQRISAAAAKPGNNNATDEVQQPNKSTATSSFPHAHQVVEIGHARWNHLIEAQLVIFVDGDGRGELFHAKAPKFAHGVFHGIGWSR